MKLLIIEGPDRCGKNTLISGLVKQADNYVVRHFGSAKGKDDLEKRAFQFDFFSKEFQLASNRRAFVNPDRERYPNDIWIWNRAHLGEFVYGTLYRDTRPFDWVWKLESTYNLDIDNDVYLLLLTAPPEFLCKRDDGQSFTSDVTKKYEEILRFGMAFNESRILNKKILDVTRDGEYRDQAEILSEVNKFLRREI